MKPSPQFALLLTAFLLTACSIPFLGGQPPTNEPAQAESICTGQPTTLTYWEDESADGGIVLDALAAEFTRSAPHVQIERIHMSYEELLGKLEQGGAPHLVRCASECAGPISRSDRFHPAEEVFDPAFLERFLPGALSAATIKGQVWGIPDNYGSVLLLIYNRKLVHDVPADTDAWIAQLQTLTRFERRQVGLAFFLDEPYWLMPWITGFGGAPLGADDQPMLNAPAVADALRFVSDLKFKYGVVLPEADYDTALDSFKRGRAAYLIDGDWSLDRLREAGIDFGVAPLPRVSATDLDPAPMTSGKFWFFGSGLAGDELAAARRFADFMTAPQAQQRWLAKARRLPSAREVAEDPLITADPVLKGIMAQLARGHGLPPAAEMQCVWSNLRPALESAMIDPAHVLSTDSVQGEAESCVTRLKVRAKP